MSQYKYKNLLFYSNRDPASLALLQELIKNPLLDQQFIKICINDNRVKVPERIIQYNKIPVIVCPGFDKPILGEDAFTWIQNNNFSEKSNGNLDFGKMENGGTDIHSQLIEEFKSSDYNQFHNNEYNLGFGQANNTAANPQFTNLGGLGGQADPTRITTFEDTETKKGAKNLLAQRMEHLQFQRENEFGTPKRAGGLEHNQAYQNNQYRQQAGMSGGNQAGMSGNGNQSGNQGGNQGSGQSVQGEPMGAQLSAFGNFGSGLDQAYEPFTDKGKSSGGESKSSLRYDPNPNVSPQMMAQQSQMTPQMTRGMPQMTRGNPGMNVNSGMNMPQMPQMNRGMPQMPQMPQMNRGNPGMNMPQMHQMNRGSMNMPQMNPQMNMPQMPQMNRGMPQNQQMTPGMNMPQMNPQMRGGMNMPQMLPGTNVSNQFLNQVGGASTDGMPPFPGNRPHPNMLLEQAQQTPAARNPYLQSNRDNANPNLDNPRPPPNALAPRGLDRPAAGAPNMSAMTPSYQGLPQPSGGSNDSNYYQL